MTDSPAGDSLVSVEGPWVRATIAFQLVIFSIPVVVAWNDTLDETYYLPMFALAATLGVGVLLLAVEGWRWVGLRLAGATIAAAVIEVALAFVLIAAYAEVTPGWDLS